MGTVVQLLQLKQGFHSDRHMKPQAPTPPHWSWVCLLHVNTRRDQLKEMQGVWCHGVWCSYAPITGCRFIHTGVLLPSGVCRVNEVKEKLLFSVRLQIHADLKMLWNTSIVNSNQSLNFNSDSDLNTLFCHFGFSPVDKVIKMFGNQGNQTVPVLPASEWIRWGFCLCRWLCSKMLTEL